MKLFKYKRKEDFGTEHCFVFFYGKHRSLFTFSVSWDDYPSWPYLHLTIGQNKFLDILFTVYKLSLYFDILSYNWLDNYETGTLEDF